MQRRMFHYYCYFCIQAVEGRDDLENMLYMIITILLNECVLDTGWVKGIALYLWFGKRRVGWMMMITIFKMNTCLLEIGDYCAILILYNDRRLDTTCKGPYWEDYVAHVTDLDAP